MAKIRKDDDKPVTQGEFRRWRHRATTGYVILAIGAVISAFALVDVFKRFESESLNRDVAIRSSQIAACRLAAGAGSANRVAILRAIRNQNRFLRDDIQDNKNIPPDFFPDIPPDKFRELLHETIRSDRGTIKSNKETVAALIGQPSCAKRYPEDLVRG